MSGRSKGMRCWLQPRTLLALTMFYGLQTAWAGPGDPTPTPTFTPSVHPRPRGFETSTATPTRTPRPVTTVFQVNTVADHDDGSCTDQDCTLREAIAAANGTAGDKGITFTVGGTILLQSSLSVTGSGHLTIDGSGQNVTLDGGNQVRILDLTANVNLALLRLTFTKGNALSVGGGAIRATMGRLIVAESTFLENRTSNDGGAIYAEGGDTVVVVQRCSFTGNLATVIGGAITTRAGSTTIQGSQFTDNGSGSGGGAIFALSLLVEDSSFTENTTSFQQSGGAVYARGQTRFNRCTFLHNDSGDVGGAIHIEQTTVRLDNCTLAKNETPRGGGAISSSGSSVQLNNCTLADNTAPVFASAIAKFDGDLTLRNTLITGAQSDKHCGGAITDGGGNLENGNTCGFSQPTSHSQTSAGLDPNGPQDHGGLTLTIALEYGSAALDAGVESVCSEVGGVAGVDQRGIERPLDGDDSGSEQCDIGAFESPTLDAPPTPTATETFTSTPTPTSTPPSESTSTPTATETETTGPQAHFVQGLVAVGQAVEVEGSLAAGSYDLCVVQQDTYILNSNYQGPTIACAQVDTTRSAFGPLTVWDQPTSGSYDLLVLDEADFIVAGDGLDADAGLIVGSTVPAAGGSLPILMVLAAGGMLLARRKPARPPVQAHRRRRG